MLLRSLKTNLFTPLFYINTNKPTPFVLVFFYVFFIAMQGKTTWATGKSICVGALLPLVVLGGITQARGLNLLGFYGKKILCHSYTVS